MTWSTVLWILLGYFVFRFVFNFLIPVIRATRQFKRQVRTFQETMQQQYGPQQQEPAYVKTQSNSNRATNASDDDYIDFEEIKE